MAGKRGSTTLTPSQTTSFTVRFDAATVGAFAGSISFASNDTTKNPFDFAVTGTANANTAPQVWSIDDGDLFNALLGEGELSPMFQALYRDLVGPNAYIAQNTAFAYLGTEHELARIEFPMWVAERGLLGRSVEIVLHQCDLGGGYPNALTRAHQFAVLHNADREGYYWLLERAGVSGGQKSPV